MRVVIVLLVIFGFCSAFAGGFFVNKILTPSTPISTISPGPVISPTGTASTAFQPAFLPGKIYMDDSLILMTKTKPYKAVVASVSRLQGTNGYNQASRASYFDGTEWQRVTTSKTTESNSIYSDDIIHSWTKELDTSRVLKERATGEIKVNDTFIEFTTGELHDEISVRSLPGYTKFLSQGEGKITVNGTTEAVDVLYEKLYSSNSSDLQFYDQPLGVTTNWLVYWDSQNNMYHADVTDVKKPTAVYQPHQIGVFQEFNGPQYKTFGVNVIRSKEEFPVRFTFDFNNPVNKQLIVERKNMINKATDEKTIWFTGTVEGANGEGRGILEFIQESE